MAEERDPLANKIVSFGPFHLVFSQQLLLEGDRPVRLGSRAFALLVALVEHAGELVSRQELLARVWPDVFVEDGNLRVHMTALRRTLGDGQGGHRFIATIPGRGYRFVAPLSSEEEAPSAPKPAAAQTRTHNLPMLPTRIVGRADVVAALASQMPQRRFITLVGPGGVGKTTVALAAAEALIPRYRDGVRFIDFAPLSDPALVPNAVAFALDVPLRTDSPLDELLSFLAAKDILLILDAAEHLVDAVATLAEQLIERTRGAHILATSREPLRAAGEHVQRLRPLGVPPPLQPLSAAEALTFPAVELFVERAGAIADDFVFTDVDAPTVVDICRRLDGLPLAIEMAASRVDAFSLQDLAAHLDNRFALLTRGRRTALQRQQTLRATLDWSYDLLSPKERLLLNRLAVFAGAFSLEAASGVVVDARLTVEDVIDGIAKLVQKSLLVADIRDAGVRYRLLDTTRAYALERLKAGGEFNQLSRAHAERIRALCERAEAEWETRPTDEWSAAYEREVDNIRTALDWAFSSDGDPALGVAVTVAAVPLWLQLSLITECRLSVERALMVPDESARRRMKLFAALGWALMYTKVPASGTAWATALGLAEQLGDIEYRLRALRGLWAVSQTTGNFRNSIELAGKFLGLAPRSANPSDLCVGERMMGAARHFLGDQAAARQHIERVLAYYVTPEHRSDIVRYQFDQRTSARNVLARILWLQGFADQARREVDDNIEYALSIHHVISLCNVLAQAACPLALLTGDLSAAERFTSMLVRNSEQHALEYLRAQAECFRGQILIRRGDLAKGLGICRSAIDRLSSAQSVQHLTLFLAALAQGLGEDGQVARGLGAVDEALQRCETYGERWCMAELLRIKGELLRRRASPGDQDGAEEHFGGSLDWARRQGAVSWQLRTATSLARLRRDQGHAAEGRQLLAAAYGEFREGFGTADLRTARELRDALSKLAGTS